MGLYGNTSAHRAAQGIKRFDDQLAEINTLENRRFLAGIRHQNPYELTCLQCKIPDTVDGVLNCRILLNIGESDFRYHQNTAQYVSKIMGYASCEQAQAL